MMTRRNYEFCLLIVILPCILGASANLCGLQDDNELVSEARDSYQKAVDWVNSQQNNQWGWEHTPSIVLSLQMTNPNWFHKDNLESQLNVKQLQIETLAALARRKNVKRKIGEPKHVNYCEDDETFGELSTGQLAYHILALHATCHDVSDFHGNSLIHLLERQMKCFKTGNFNNYFQYSLGVLALCNAGGKVKKQHVTELMKGQYSDDGYQHCHDSTAMVMMALSCVSKLPEFSNSTKLNSTLQKAKNFLKQCPARKDCLGNIHSLALYTQAMKSIDEDPTEWDCEAVTHKLIKVQQQSGSFGEHLMTTMQVLPSLVGAHYGSIDTNGCRQVEEDQEKVDADFGINIAPPHKYIKMSVITDENSSNELMIERIVAADSSLYDIMVTLATEHGGAFNFTASDSEWGRYVQSINGVAADSKAERFWAIYSNLHPDGLMLGVEDYYPADKEHISFKYGYRGQCHDGQRSAEDEDTGR